jgi:hypothetical protein
MGVGADHILSKGHLATGSTAYKLGELVVASGDGTKCARATTANSVVRGVCGENLDTNRLGSGKAVIQVNMLGISRVLAGAAVSVDAYVTNDATARAVTATAGQNVLGKALTAATAAGQYIDVLLTPGAIVAPAA